MIDYERIRQFYDQHRPENEDDPDFLRGTVESSLGIARFRNRAEARHLARAFTPAAGSSVLDLGAGTGRWSVFFAERGARVTSVELAPSLAHAAARHAARRQLPIDCRVGTILAPPLEPDASFDVVHIGGVLVYINDADLTRVRDVVLAATRRGSTLVLREPVDPNGPSEQQHADGYHALFRRPERYVELFAPEFRLQYERTTVSHLVPRGRNTLSVVSSLKGAAWRRWLVDHALPLVGYVDHALLGLEERLRASALRGLLGDPGVVQHFYVFQRDSR